LSRLVVVRDELGETERDEADFPLSIGRAAEADLRLPGRGVEEPVAYLGMHDGAPFVQPAESGIPIFCNERLVESARWLENGDTLRIETARIACDLSDARVEFRVSDAAPALRDGPVLVLPPPIAQPQLAPDLPAPDIQVPQRVVARASAWTWILSLVGAALLTGVWFLLTASAIRVQVDPEPDDVSIVGAFFSLELGDRFLLRPGSYEVRATKQGYYPAREPIEVSAEDDQSFAVLLQRLPGLLTVVTGEVEGSRVRSDGVPLGETPLQDAELVAGVHTLLIESDRYVPETLEIEIEGGGIQQRIDVELTPAWTPYRFVSEPTGAELSVDGVPVGTTPLTAELLAGERQLSLALPGYATWRDEVPVLANQPLEERLVALRLADATIVLSSAPRAASVTVDGHFHGRTPVELELTPGDTHRIELFKQGHERAVRKLSLEAGETRELRVRLVAQRGEVTVVSDPPDAELWVDGASRGPAIQTLLLSAVPHVIEVRKPGHVSFRTVVTPSPGIPEKVRATLPTLEDAEIEEVAARIVTGAGQVLRRVDPGQFEMGAARREQGRRSNEVQHSVALTRPFYVATQEVNNRQFREFSSGHASGIFGGFSLDEDDQPVVRVGWDEAARYCNWLSQRDGLPPAYVDRGGSLQLGDPVGPGYRLPTEAEWAWAARYAGSPGGHKYPWGGALPPTQLSGNYGDTSARASLPNVISGYRDDFPVSSSVGSFPANALGLHDLGGNVAEWVNDLYAVSYGSQQTQTDPVGPESGRFHVVRGASWQDSSITELRWSYRDYSAEARADVGFRIARYPE
jgi:formylglycine-generating enzyme required for sulfatase activity